MAIRTRKFKRNGEEKTFKQLRKAYPNVSFPKDWKNVPFDAPDGWKFTVEEYGPAVKRQDPDPLEDV